MAAGWTEKGCVLGYTLAEKRVCSRSTVRYRVGRFQRIDSLARVGLACRPNLVRVSIQTLDNLRGPYTTPTIAEIGKHNVTR